MTARHPLGRLLDGPCHVLLRHLMTGAFTAAGLAALLAAAEPAAANPMVAFIWFGMIFGVFWVYARRYDL